MRTALATPRTGSSDSAAAMVTVSRPPYAKTEASRPTTRPSPPPGKKPPRPVRFAVPGESVPGRRPATARTPRTRNRTIAPTFRAANQNSNSPKFFTAVRFVPQKTSMNRATQAHSGVPGSHPVTIFAAPMPSRPTAVHSSTQNDHPAVKPAQGPIARSACAEKEPEEGCAADISPSIRITSITRSPESV
ncbi:hypothetical protein M2162_005365 [Streptomyces sp. SAI-041]|nr:hypothetical protein [Streptomyces sp. SAI-041]